jgi:hypothetical protein
MKRIKKILLVLTIVSVSLLGLSACKTSSATQENGMPNLDSLVEFNGQGYAVLRGTLVNDPASKNLVHLQMPATMDGVNVVLDIPFRLRNDTTISSTITKKTDVLEYQSFNKTSTIANAFPEDVQVDVTFRDQVGGFEALSIYEAKKTFALFDSVLELDPVFTKEGVNQGTLTGHIQQTYTDEYDVLTWDVGVPVQIKSTQAQVLIAVQSAPDTVVITTGDTIIMLDTISGNVQIKFIRDRRDTLTAKEITELP